LERLGRRLQLIDPAPRLARLLESGPGRRRFDMTADSAPSYAAGG
jgi:hypothetical protein